MAFSFPTSPTNGQTFVQGSVTFTYNSTLDQWVGAAGGSSGPTTGVITGTAAQDYQVAATAPGTRSVAGANGALVDGDQWFDTTNNALMVRKTGVWVKAITSSSGSWFAIYTGSDHKIYGPPNTTISIEASVPGLNIAVVSVTTNAQGKATYAGTWSIVDTSTTTDMNVFVRTASAMISSLAAGSYPAATVAAARIGYFPRFIGQ
jgi:hypothetical protein